MHTLPQILHNKHIHMTISASKKHLIFAERKAASMPFDYRLWYEANKQWLSEKRRQRYASDAEFRAKAVERSRKHVQAKVHPVTDGHTVSFESAAKQIGITIWVLRDWRRKGYFPDPVRRSGNLWFTEHQITLLQKLKTSWHQIVFTSHYQKEERLEELREVIESNWQG